MNSETKRPAELAAAHGSAELWQCRQCGYKIDSREIIAKGYGHTVTIFDGGEYKEAICGPCDPPNVQADAREGGRK